MRRAAPVILAILAAAAAVAGDPSAARALEAQLRVERSLLAAKAARLQRTVEELGEAHRRVAQLAADFERAVQDGESRDSLELRDADLRIAESELVLRIVEAQRLRGAVTEALARVAALGNALAAAREAGGGRPDPITGRWRLVIEPGGIGGTMELRLDGTVISGTYDLDGGWYGSFKGTLVAGKVRLERIDSQLGFAAVFYGTLDPAEPPRLAGTWEGTNLAAGLPAGGTWMAERLPQDEAALAAPEE